MAVSINQGTPQIIHEKIWIFHEINYPAMGYSILILGDHHIQSRFNFLTGYTCSLQFAMPHSWGPESNFWRIRVCFLMGFVKLTIAVIISLFFMAIAT